MPELIQSHRSLCQRMARTFLEFTKRILFASYYPEKICTQNLRESTMELGARGLIAAGAFYCLGFSTVSAAESASEMSAKTTLVCPNIGSEEPKLRDVDGTILPIKDPKIKASAAAACSGSASHFSPSVSSYIVGIQNQRSKPIYVDFWQPSAPGPIWWDPNGCNHQGVGTGAVIAPGATCWAALNNTAGQSRFCAVEYIQGILGLNCNVGQTYHLTLVETVFQSECFNNANCAWYDISIIPPYWCTDYQWQLNRCNNSHGASYNLPVGLACGNSNNYTYTYICRGPVGPLSSTAPNTSYPTNCGIPYPSSTCHSSPSNYNPACNNAYFYPMFSYGASVQPNTYCAGASSYLVITFFAGQ